MKNSIKSVLVGGMLAAFSVAATAQQYSEIYVFGDSLSDTGNLQAVSPEPGIPERFTNGPVAVEVLAAQLGFSISNSNHLLPLEVTGGVFGNNYAIAGAKSTDDDGDETTPDINLPTQVNAFLQIHGGYAPMDALYVVMIGGNDIRAARSLKVLGIDGSGKLARQSIRESVNSEAAQISKLVAAGARNIVVVNAPDVGAIPETDLVAMQALAVAETRKQERVANRLEEKTRVLSTKFNTRLANKIERIEEKNDIDIVEFDLFEFLASQIDSAEEVGLTNTTEACIWAFSSQTINPECSDFPAATGFLFWDEIHPTTAAHQRAGAALYETLLDETAQ